MTNSKFGFIKIKYEHGMTQEDGLYSSFSEHLDDSTGEIKHALMLTLKT